MTESHDEPADAAARAVVAILGGTGDQGRGLGRRLARAGNRVVIGSRDAARAAGLNKNEVAKAEAAAEAEAPPAAEEAPAKPKKVKKEKKEPSAKEK